jgi:hypothetical protein
MSEGMPEGVSMDEIVPKGGFWDGFDTGTVAEAGGTVHVVPSEVAGIAGNAG